MAETIVLDKCYQYSITLCGVTYTLPAYNIQSEAESYFVMNQPVDPDNSECINEFSWGFTLYYAIDYPSVSNDSWVLADGNDTVMAYFTTDDTSIPSSTPFSEWAIVEGTDGALIVDFSIEEVSCPVRSCDCLISVSLEMVDGEISIPQTLQGEPVGIFDGKTLYKIYNTLYGDLAVYWSYVDNRWSIDYWDNIYVFPSLNPPVYLTGSSDCPDGTYVNNPLYVDPLPFLNAVVTLNDCYTYPSISEYCCIKIGFSNGIDIVQYDLVLTTSYWPGLGDIATYKFLLNGEDCSIIYNSTTSRWELINVASNPILLAYSTTASDTCPVSSIADWSITEDGYAYIAKIKSSDPDHPYNLLYTYECGTDEVILPGDHDAIDCDPFIPCQNNQTLKRSSAVLSKEIASISKREVFGFNCDDAWNTIFMKNSIIHALSCLPYGFYSEADEQCLIGKLNDKCNC